MLHTSNTLHTHLNCLKEQPLYHDTNVNNIETNGNNKVFFLFMSTLKTGKYFDNKYIPCREIMDSIDLFLYRKVTKGSN